MTSVEVTFPDSLFAALRKAPHEIGPEVREAAKTRRFKVCDAFLRDFAASREKWVAGEASAVN